MSFSLRPIIEGTITENRTTYSRKWILAENAQKKDFQKDALDYFCKHYVDTNPRNCQVVNTFFHQYSTSSFTFLQLQTKTKYCDIQFTQKINNPVEQPLNLPINPKNFTKKVIKTSIALDSSVEKLSDSIASVHFSPKNSVSRVYSYSMVKNSHDPMLRAFFDSSYTSVSTHVGGCENHYRVTQMEQEGTIIHEPIPPARRQIWSIK